MSNKGFEPKVGGNQPSANREVWRRFKLIAQPYFYPIDAGGVGPGLLTLGLLAGVAGCAFWLTFIVVGVLLVIMPPESVPGVTPELQQQMTAHSWPWFASACLALAAGLALTHRRQLHGRWRRWATLALLLLLLLCVTCLTVLLSYVFRDIDNALHDRDEKGFWQTTLQGYGFILVVAVPIYGLYKYTRMKFARHWRRWLCEFFLKRYLSHQAYYRLDSNSVDTQIDNPDQRITEDVSYFTEESLDFILDVLNSIMELFSFSAVLYSTSPSLMCILILYAIAGTVLALIIGKRLVGINYEQLRREADLRYSLVRVRENAESIAFYSGEALEGEGIQKRLDFALENYDQLINWNTITTVYLKCFYYLAGLGPYLAIGPLYFAREVDFGTFTQGSFAFYMVLSSITLVISRIKDISRFAAGINRLGAFYDALAIDGDVLSGGSGTVTHTTEEVTHTTEEVGWACWKRRVDSQVASNAVELIGSMENGVANGSEQRKVGEILSVPASGVMLEIKQMTLLTPTGRILTGSLNLALDNKGTDSPGRLLIVGPSGVGKSSVLRAIAGLWTRGSGEIHRPLRGEMLFLPQKPYMPLGDLRMQLLYPNPFADTTNEALSEILGKLGLHDLPSRFAGGFEAVQDWGRVLSVGEQQRVAAARCLLTSPAPSLLVLDEATSALPVEDEAVLYGLLWERGIGYISVGHRESLHQYHDLVLELSGEGAWRLRPPDTIADQALSRSRASSFSQFPRKQKISDADV